MKAHAATPVLTFCSLVACAQDAAADDPRSDPDAYYQLSTAWQGFCGSLDIVNDGRNNTPILAPTGLFSGQHWKLTPAGNGFYHLSTEWQGESKRLDIVNDGQNDKPALAAAGDFSGQHWKIEPAARPGYFNLSTMWQGPQKRLDIVNDGRNDKPRLALAGNFSGQNWLFTRVARVGPVPASLGVDPFYRKYIDAGGIPVLSSQRVADAALYRARYLILQMLAGQDTVREAMVRNGARVAIMAPTEGTLTIPEHRYLGFGEGKLVNWNARARGLGGTTAVPIGSGAQENVLCLDLDRYAGEDILIHEFAHTIHNLGLVPTYPDFQSKLDAAFENAKQGRWADAGPTGQDGETYALTDAWEYFAEGVQSWFNVNRQPNASHNQVDTREELAAYDPQLYELIASYFPADVRACSCHAD